MQALHVGNSDSTPSFYMIDQNLDEMYTKGFQHHPARIDTLEKATFAVTCCFNGRSLQKFADLPRRSKAKPYLVIVRGFSMDRCSPKDNCKLASELIETRDDFMYVNFDLRDHNLKDDHAPPLRGVTMTPPRWYQGSPLSPSQDAKYFMTFRGRLKDGWYESSHVRTQIQKAFSDFKADGVVVDFLADNHLGQSQYSKQDHDTYNDLLNVSYGLVPHGDGRWNYRFSEVVGACAIPVVLADGLTLPFEELIDWRDAAVLLQEETLSLDPNSLLNQLPRDPAQIQKKRRRICEINDKFFATEEKRVTALLQSAAIRSQH
jgi:hypothetical protein